ncbi:MAG: hypothetical protein KA054_00210 [Candidatus Moranbacteria bacterium]|nr:hypothetical protein [Candidatus Moranbacteria bacterium]
MFGFGERSKEPKKEERMPAARVVVPEEVPKKIAGGALSAEGSKEEGFGGYATLDGELIDGRTEMRRFEDARGFSLVDDASSRPTTPETSQQEVIVSAKVATTEIDLTRQRALEMPDGLEGEALAAALEAKRDEFKKYFEEKWKGRMWESNPAKDADLDCLIALQGRAAGARQRVESSGANRMVLKKITEAEAEEELAQIHADIVPALQRLLGELAQVPLDETERRRQIQAGMKDLRTLQKSGTEKDLREWRDAHARHSPSPVGEPDEYDEYNESDWSKP